MTELEKKRVVITGLGAITPLGNDLDAYWQGLLQGRSGIGSITQFDASQHASRIAGEVKGFDPSGYLDRKDVKRMDRFAQFAVVASKQALADAQLEITDLNAEQVGAIIGTGVGGLRVMEEQQSVYLNKGPSRCSPFMVPMMIANMAAGLTAIHTGAKGPNTCPVTACAAGSNAIGDAFRMVQQGYAQAMICGGTESAVTPLAVAGFASARALSTRNDDPSQASRPFRSRSRWLCDGGRQRHFDFGILRSRLEPRGTHLWGNGGLWHDLRRLPHDHSSPRGRRCRPLYATRPERCGPHPRAGQLCECPRHQYRRERPYGDPGNQDCAGRNRLSVPVSSTKSMTGHLLGGSGGIEGVAAAMAIAHDCVPPTLNLENPDEGCDLDYVPHQARNAGRCGPLQLLWFWGAQCHPGFSEVS
jgi:3-oxoacyl-[acyl-carrier-protein] synthase II